MRRDSDYPPSHARTRTIFPVHCFPAMSSTTMSVDALQYRYEYKYGVFLYVSDLLNVTKYKYSYGCCCTVRVLVQAR